MLLYGVYKKSPGWTPKSTKLTEIFVTEVPPELILVSTPISVPLLKSWIVVTYKLAELERGVSVIVSVFIFFF